MLAATVLISVSFLVQLHPSNGLGVSGDDDDSFFQHVFYEVDEHQSEPNSDGVDPSLDDSASTTTKLEHEINLLEEKVSDRVSRIVSPTLFDVPPPFKEYARMARFVVHNSGWSRQRMVAALVTHEKLDFL